MRGNGNVLRLGVVLVLVLTAAPAAAQLITNGDFENGLTGWTVSGVDRVDTLTSSQLSNHPQSNGSFSGHFVLVTNGPGDRNGSNLYTDGNGTGGTREDRDRSFLSTTFQLSGPATISFDWAFVTDEADEGLQYDDFFYVRLTGGEAISHSGCNSSQTSNLLFCGSVNRIQGSANWSGFMDTPSYDDDVYVATKGGSPVNGARFDDGTTGWRTFTATLNPPGNTTYTLLFGVADQADVVIDSGVLIDNVRVVTAADLAITKSDGVTTAIPGQPVEYDITVTNAGPSDADCAVVTDNFPASLTGVTWECVPGGGASCTGVNPGDTSSGSGNVNASVDIPVGGSLTYTATGTVSPSATGTLVNTASVAVNGCAVDPNTANNTATDVDTLSPTQSLFQLTATSGGVLVAKNGGLDFTTVTNNQVTVNGAFSVIAFVSNANLTGGNPDSGSEVFVLTAQGVEQITQVAEPLLFLHAAHPDLSASGDWLVFESLADLLPPGNADGNREVFRFHRPTSTLLQLTNTGTTAPGCVNKTPKVNDDGAVAFVTTCASEIAGGFNADRNQELVVRTSGGAFVTLGTTGCTNRDPAIARGAGGSRVAFLSTCNVTGGNANGNVEVVQWAWAQGQAGYAQVTNTGAAVNNEAVSSSSTGNTLVFISSGSFTGASNPEGNLEVFSFNRTNGTFAAVTATGSGVFHTFVRLDPSAQHVVYERIDAIQQSFETFHRRLGTATETAIVVGTSTFPAIGLAGSSPVVTFESNSNSGGGNSDGNLEIWLAIVP